MTTQQGPILVVAAGVARGDRVLLARREEPGLVGGHLKWELPGGKVEFGESPEQAVQREIYEELRLRIIPESLIPYVHTSIWEKAGAKKHYAIICYRSVLVGPDDFSLTQLPSRVAWFRRDEIDYSMTLPGTREFVEQLFPSGEHAEQVMTCLVRLEPVDKDTPPSPVDYVEIHIWPNILANMSDSLAICIIIHRRQGGRIRLPAALQPYIYKAHRRRAGLSCSLLNKETVMDEFRRIVGQFKMMGYWATKFYGDSKFLEPLEMPA